MLADRHNFINITHLSTRCAQIKAVEECDEVFFFFTLGKLEKTVVTTKVSYFHISPLYILCEAFIFFFISSPILQTELNVSVVKG